MSDLELCYLPAHEALARFRARTLSPVELLSAVIARADAVEPAINAFTYRYFDEAMAAARVAEDRYMRPSADPRPLEGLPVAFKDTGGLAGKPTSWGSLAAEDAPAEETTPLHKRVLDAGAVVHARTATPEFSCAAVCHSKRWGVTRNPWSLAHTPGGSSGGAGAALAAGTTTLATGSDIGGSIRIPASCSRVVGYKPPTGRNPVDPPFNLDPYCHTGPLARDIRDAALLQNALCGPHPQDIATLRPAYALPERFEPIAGWRIGYSIDLGFFQVDPAVRANTLAALDVFRSLGATVEEATPPWDAAVLTAAIDHLAHLFGASIAPYLETKADLLTDYARVFAERGRMSTPARFLASMETAAEAYRAFGPILERYDLFICPTTAIAAAPAEFDPSRDRLRIDGAEVSPMLGWVMTAPFNMLGRCPVLAAPSGFAPDGAPTGIQLVGRTYCDVDVFRAGVAYEAAVGGWYRTPVDRPDALDG